MGKLAVAVVPVTQFSQNCTLLYDTESKEAVVVDPGGDAARVRAAADERGLNVGAIWLTHGHLDHAGGVADLNGMLPAPVPVIGPHAADEFLLQGIARQAELYGLSGMRDARSDRYLTEGEVLEVGGHSFKVLHCPGHTPGHVVFFCEGARFAQVGDVLFAGSVGRTDFPYGDHAALIASIKTKLLPLGDDVRFVCGHGDASSLGAERRNNPFLN